MAIPSSPSATELQYSMPPPPQSSHPSAHRQPSTPQPTGRSSMSSSVGQRQIQPPRRSPALVGSPQQQTADRQVASNQAGGEVSSAVANSKRRYHFWTDKDDSLLMAAIKRHGTQWQKVKEFIDEGGGTPRLAASLPQRYQLLVRRKKAGIQERGGGSVKRNTAAPATATSTTSITPGQLHLHSGAASGGPGPSTPHERHADYQMWSEQEVQKISSISRSMSTRSVFPAFRATFPSTTRTKGGVVAKWRRVHDLGPSVKADDSGSVGGEWLDFEVQDSAWEDNPSLMPDEGQAVGAPSAMLHASQQQPSRGAREGPRESPYSSSGTAPMMQDVARQSEAPLRLQAPDLKHARTARPCLEAPQSATRPASSANGTSAQLGPPSAPSPYPQWPSQSHAISYFVIRTRNGFLITDLPMGYGLLIHTPTRCQVVGPDEQVLAQPEAPFAFKLKPDAAIEAINLPRGTATSICLVRAGAGDGRGEADAGNDGRLVSQTSFVARDGFSVVFESEVA